MEKILLFDMLLRAVDKCKLIWIFQNCVELAMTLASTTSCGG